MINEIKNYSVEVRTNKKPSINAAKFIFKILFFSILLTLVLYYCVTRTKLSSKKRFLMQLLESKDLFIPIRTSYTQQGLECPTLFRANYSTFDGPKVRDYPSTSDSEIIGTILMRMRRDRDFVSELLKGANIVVRGDKGAIYEWFISTPQAYNRLSSHFSQRDQFGLDLGGNLKTLLTGVDSEGDTWFQFEGAAFNFFKNPLEVLIVLSRFLSLVFHSPFSQAILHILQYIQYLVTDKQVGPLGTSKFTDARPIYVLFDDCSHKKEERSRKKKRKKKEGWFNRHRWLRGGDH